MTRDTYTKAASLACLKWMLPEGKLTLVGEREGQMGRVVPHIFREEILADRFEWAIIGFRKDAPIDEIREEQAKFSESLRDWREIHPHLTPWEALQSWTAANLEPAYHTDPNDGTISPWVGANLASAAFPRLWVRSPVQTANELDKTVGFPILSPRYRAAYRRLGINDKIDDPELRAAITRRVVMATIQPTSTFMNAIRERVSIIQRAGGRSARMGGSYINGAAYNPRVLIALMNIWRVHYNFFDWRPYRLPLEEEVASPEGTEVEAKEDSPAPADNDKQQMRRIPYRGRARRSLCRKGAPAVSSALPRRCGWACISPRGRRKGGVSRTTSKRRRHQARRSGRSEIAGETTALTCLTCRGFSTSRGCSTERRCGRSFRDADG